MLAGAALFMAGNAYAATAVTPATGGTANPFAYALSSEEGEGVVTINYSLNTDATAVAINFIGNQGTVIKTDRAKKIIVYKQRPKKGYRRKYGHRQGFARVMINKIRTTAAKKAETAEVSES